MADPGDPSVGAADPCPLTAREILDQLPLAVSFVDSAGVFAYVNAAAGVLFGSSPEDLVGKPAAAIAVATSDTAAAAAVASKIAAGERWSGAFPITREDGHRTHAWFSAAPIGASGVLVAGIEVSALTGWPGGGAGDELATAARAEAEEANQLLATLLDSVPVGMAFFDARGRFVRVNRWLADLDGVSPEGHVGKDVRTFLAGLPAEVADDIERVFETGETLTDRRVQGTTPRDPGVTHHWIVNYYPIRLRGDVVWVGATVVEVTEWRRSEQERADLLEAEKAARHAAEEAAQRLARLQIITGRLAEATTVGRVADVVVSQGAAGVVATSAALMIVTADGTAMRIVDARGFEQSSMAQFAEFPLAADLPASRAARTLEPVFLESLAARDREFPSLAGAPALGQSFAIVPLVMDGRALGAVAFGWSYERSFAQADRDFLLALGRQAALAIERGRLYDAEREARAVAEEARERMAFLAEASRVLSSSLDYRETLAKMAQLAVPEVADACAVHLLEDDGLRLVVVAHGDPEKQRIMEQLTTPRGPSQQPMLLGRVAVTGTPVVLPEVPDELWQQLARDEEHLEALRSLALRSAVFVPLASSGRIHGVLSLATLETSRAYHEHDLPFVLDLASRAAVAIENSRAHQARTEVARTLQASLLPPHLPHIHGLELASRYHSAGDVDVGGDFYDVFPSGDGRWGVVMGDVCGKGIAAASLTALARYTVRAGAIDEGEPTQVLHLLNKAILESVTDERFCTITYVVVEPSEEAAGGPAKVRLASGGHPLPLLVGADGVVREVGVPGTAVGLFEEITVEEVDVTLSPGDALVLYTDGFVEVRSPDGRFAPDLLRAALAAAAGAGVSAEGLAEAVDRAVLAFEGGRPRDDMALLIVRVPSA